MVLKFYSDMYSNVQSCLTIEVDHFEHFLDLVSGEFVAEGEHDRLELLQRDEAIVVLVKYGERQPQIWSRDKQSHVQVIQFE